MKLTPKQVHHIRQEMKTLQRIIEAQPKVGFLAAAIRLTTLSLFLEINNIKED